MNAAEAFAAQAAANPSRPALHGPRSSWTYGELLQVVGDMASGLVDAGVRPGVVVGLGCDPVDYVNATLAVAWAGGTSVNLLGLEGAELERMARLTGATLMVANERHRPPGLPPALAFLSLRDLLARAGGEVPVADCAPEATWRIGFSSGTTGQRKAVRFSHASAVEKSRLLSQVEGLPPACTLVHAGHALSMAVTWWMRELASGGTAVIGIPHPMDVLVALERHDVQFYVGSPNNALLVAAAAKKSGRPVARTLRTALVTGAAIRPAQRQRLREALCPAIWASYGSTELGVLTLMPPAMEPGDAGCVGPVAPWAEVRVLDESGAPVPPGVEGQLSLRSTFMASGYILDDGAQEAQRTAFEGGWFRSNDRGRVDAAGMLSISGRADDVLNIGGTKLHPADVERVLDEFPGVIESAVAPHETRAGALALAAYVVAEEPLDMAALRTHCVTRLQERQVPARFVQVESLPRNEAGKVIREQLTRRGA